MPHPLRLLGALSVVFAVACSDSGGASTANSPDTGVTSAEPDADASEDTAAPEDAEAPDTAEPDAADPDAEAMDAAMDATPDVEEPLVYCDPPTPLESALLRVGDNDGTFVNLGGQAITPAGRQVHLGQFPSVVALHPTRPLAYVQNASGRRGLRVVNTEQGEVVQDVFSGRGFHGMALSADGLGLYSASGEAGVLDVYDVSPVDGTLGLADQVALEGYVSAVTVSADDMTVWAGEFWGRRVVEIDRETREVRRSMRLPIEVYDLLELPSRGLLYAVGIRSRRVVVIDLERWEVAADIDVGGGAPTGIAATAAEDRVFVTVSDNDTLVVLDPTTHAVVETAAVGDEALVSPDGELLNAFGPSHLAATAERLYVVRSLDNTVEVLDIDTLEPLGLIPTAFFPADVAVRDGLIAVVNAKGWGAGAHGEAGEGFERDGTLSLIDEAGLELEALTAQARRNALLPTRAFDFTCAQGETFPVPPRLGLPSPIEHVILVVRENQTYDGMLGEHPDPDADSDPSFSRWGPTVTPNLFALVDQFAHHDNFYAEGGNSIQGHLWLTQGAINHYMERVGVRARGSSLFGTQEVPTDVALPDWGNFFTHLIEHGVSFRVFGEAAVLFGGAEGPDGVEQMVSEYVDFGFPGLFYNMDIKDQEKIEHVIAQLEEGGLPQFSYILIPNDHTFGLQDDKPTPESMVSDNDYATGLLIDYLSHRPDWDKVAVFIVEDDPQGGRDHVHRHRSIMVVASPWARRGHTSHVLTSNPSLFKTFELILNLPPMHRLDATATPLWDAFATEPDLTPFNARSREVPDQLNSEVDRDKSLRGLEVARAWSRLIDFGGPDRCEDLQDIVAVVRKGGPPPGSRLDRVLRGEIPDTGPDVEEEELEEIELYDMAWRHVRDHLARHPERRAELRRVTWPAWLEPLPEVQP